MNRIAELRKRAKISQAALGRAIGAAQNTVCNWENGNREPDVNYLQALANFFGVSVDYLLGRESPEHPPSSTGGTWVPVLGQVAAGIPIEAVENVEDYEEISRDLSLSGEYFALRIRGASMEPKMSEGDVVIVRKQPDCNNGDTAVVLVNGDSATVKKIKRTEQGILLIPLNPSFETMFYSNEEITSLPVSILGKVVELRAKF